MAGGRPARPRPPRGNRRLLFLAVLCSLQLACLLAAVEIVARMLVPDPFIVQDDLLGMLQNAGEDSALRPVPGWEGTLTVEGRQVPIRLNSLGLRSPEPGARRSGELRVLFLGDSFVFGFGVAERQAFPTLAGIRLERALDRPVLIGNAGVPGYGTCEQAASLGRLKEPFDPDVVVATIYLGNDFMDDMIVSRYAAGGLLISGDWAQLLRSSPRARMATRSRALMWLELLLMEHGSPLALRPGARQQVELAGFPRYTPNLGLFMDVIDESHSWDPAVPVPVVPRVLARLEQSLARIRDVAARAPVLVVIMPSFWHLQPAAWTAHLQRVGMDPEDYRMGLTQERLRAVCARLDLPVLDITDEVRSLGDPTGIFLPQDRHLNPAGHRFAAEAVSERVRETLREGR